MAESWHTASATEYVRAKSSQDAIVASSWPDLLRVAAEAGSTFRGPTILDLGCGDGGHSAALAEAVHNAAVLGVDMSSSMIEGAVGRAHARLSFSIADAAALPAELRVGGFDLCCSFHCLHWPAADAARPILAGVAQALRPGGRFFATFHGEGSMEPLFEEVRACLRERGQPESAFVGLTRFSASEYEALLRDAGFRAPSGSDAPMVRLTPFTSEMQGAEGVASRMRAAWGPMLAVPPPAGLWDDVGRRYATRAGEASGTVPLACQLLRVDAERV